MKRVMSIFVLALCFGAFSYAQTEWQGRVARGASQDFPAEGYYAASNSFPRNTIVSVTNPTTGKSVRVVVSRGLSDNSLFMTLSGDAARALGLDGNFPATMKAQPVIVPGISDQSIGSELPYNRDPDINPAVSAAGATSASASPSPAVAQPPSKSIVQSAGQAASSQPAPSASPAAASPTVPDLDAVSLSPAARTAVAAGQAAAELDLSASTPIAGPVADALPAEVVRTAGRSAETGAPPPALPAANTAPAASPAPTAHALEAASTQPVAQGEAPVVETPASDEPVATGLAALSSEAPAANQASSQASSALPAGQPATAQAPSGQTLVKAPAETTAPAALSPAIMAPVLPASVPSTGQVAANGLSTSPVVANRDMPATIPGRIQPASAAVPVAAADLLPAVAEPVVATNAAAPALVGLAAANRAPVASAAAGSPAYGAPTVSPTPSAAPQVPGTVQSGVQAGIQVGAVKNPSGASAAAVSAAPASAVRAGAGGIGARALGTDVGNRPGASNVPVPQSAPSPAPKAVSRGMGMGILSMGAPDGVAPALGDVARPEHAFNPPASQSAAPEAAFLQAPKTVKTDGSLSAGSAAPADGLGLLDRQLAAVRQRAGDRTLFREAAPEESVAVLPSVKAGKLGDPVLSGLPAAAFPGIAGQRPDASLPDLSMSYPEPGAGQLPVANAKAAVKPEQSLSGIKAGIATGIGANLPAVKAPGLISGDRADGSLAGLTPAARETDASLPVAAAPGKAVPDSVLSARAGAAPGMAASELPSVQAPGVSRADAGLAGSRAGAVTLDANGLPVARVPDQPSADGSLATAFPGDSGYDPVTGLPLAAAPGLSRAEASNPWLEGTLVADGTAPSLPLARVVPGDLPQAALAGASPGLALVPDKDDLPMVALELGGAQSSLAGETPGAAAVPDTGLPMAAAKGQESAEDPLMALRPLETVASLEPAGLKPPVLRDSSVEGGLAAASPSDGRTGGVALGEPQVRLATGDPGLSGASPLSAGADNTELSRPKVRSGSGDPSLATASPSGTGPSGVALSQPSVRSATGDAGLAVASPAVAEAGDLALGQPQVRLSSGDPGLSGTRPASSADGTVTLTQPAVRSASGDPSFASAAAAGTGLDGVALSQPSVRSASGDPSFAAAAATRQGIDGAALDSPAVRTGAGDASLASTQPAAGPAGAEPLLALAATPQKGSRDTLLANIRPTQEPVSGELAVPGRNAPDTLAGQTGPGSPVGPVDLAQAKTPEGKTLDQGLPGQAKAQPSSEVAVKPVQPNLPGQKPAASAEANRILSLLEQNAPKVTVPVKPETPGSAVATPPAAAAKTADEQWVQKNLPLAKSLEKAKYYLQVGAFANPRSAKKAIEDVAKGYQITVVPESGKDRPVYKVFVGPLKEDEKGLLLYLFRSKGYKDAFIKQGQP